jgi:hypothetical protein
VSDFSKELSPEAFVKRLEAISDNGILLISREQKKYSESVQQYVGHFALTSAFKCFFLKTVELINTEVRPKIKSAVPDFYAEFVPRLAHNFHSFCGAETVATCGYPLHAYTLFRNTFDSLILTSAVLQKFTDFLSIEGIESGHSLQLPFDMKTFKKLKNNRKKVESEVREKMTGRQSDLTPQTLEALEKWDMLFDWETHGARLSLGQAVGWMRGKDPLPVLPHFNEMHFGMFMNRACEIGWMIHRLIPTLQLTGLPLPDSWKEKWQILDCSFEQCVNALTKHCEKPIGAAIVELVNKKFPFNENSLFPL